MAAIQVHTIIIFSQDKYIAKQDVNVHISDAKNARNKAFKDPGPTHIVCMSLILLVNGVVIGYKIYMHTRVYDN